MTYVEYLNALIREQVCDKDRLLIFGQNIAAGSCLSGLTRNISVRSGNMVINTPNAENALCGVGFGAMMNGVNAIFFMKQLDFLFLGLDHLINTFNIVRRSALKTSFTIFPIIVDSGYEGPQASANNLSDFCASARVDGFTLTSAVDSREIIKAHLVAPGVRIICSSQRLFKTEVIDSPAIDMDVEQGIFQYRAGNDVTVICFNLSLPNGLELAIHLERAGLKLDLFSVNKTMVGRWDKIFRSLQKTKKLVIIDDSKSVNTSWKDLLNELPTSAPLKNKIVVGRKLEGYYLRPCMDQLEVDYQSIVDELVQEKRKTCNRGQGSKILLDSSS